MPFPPKMLEEELARHDSVKMVSVVHAETSTGVLQPLGEIARLGKAHGALLMVDAVTSLGGSEFAFDETDIDYAYSCSQKCLGAPPGICPVAIGPRALEVIDVADDEAALVVPRSRSHRKVLGAGARVPPHRADQHDPGSARGAADRPGGGSR